MSGTSTSGTAVFSLKISRDQLDRYKAIVEADHRTISQALRLHVDKTIAAADRKKAA